MKVLLLQGDYLLKINHFSNLDKSVYSSGQKEYCGGIIGFFICLKDLMDKFFFDKIVVVWDGFYDGYYKYNRYPALRAMKEEQWNHKKAAISFPLMELTKKEFHEHFIIQQKMKLNELLDELFIRQIESEVDESYDIIGTYVQEALKVGEEIYIFGKPNMFNQILGPNVKVIANDHDIVTSDSIYKTSGYDTTNDLMIRCFTGMNGTIVKGIRGLTIERLLAKIPGLKLSHYGYDELLSYVRKKKIESKSKIYDMILGAHELVKRNANLLNLKNTHLSNSALKEMNAALYSPFSSEERNIDNLIKKFQSSKYVRFIDMNLNEFFDSFRRLSATEKEYMIFMNN